MFARLLGVRDGSSRDATTAEMTEVAKHLYFFLVKRYHEGLKSGKWEKWHEERDFPRHEFEDHSSRDDGVFDGFDFTKWAELKLVSGVEGTKAVEVVGGSKMKVMMWQSSLCGGGLETSIKEAIGDHLNTQGAMTVAEYNKKKANIWNDITVFLRSKGWNWRNEQHLFGSGKEQQKMKKHCGKKIGTDHIILMLKSDEYESA